MKQCEKKILHKILMNFYINNSTNKSIIYYSIYLKYQMQKKEQKDQGAQEQKTYVKSKMKWKQFQLNKQIIEVLKAQGKIKPTRIQQETLSITTNPDRKKFTLLIRSSNGSGKTLCYLLPILNSLKPGLPIAKDKIFMGKTQVNEIFMPQAIILVQTAMLVQQIEQELHKILKQAQKLGKPQFLNFTVGRMDKEKHIPGDIIIAMPKSFDNRYERKNIKLDQVTFFAIDQIDEIYDQDTNILKKILLLNQQNKSTKLIVCSATMKKQFKQFFKQTCKNCIEINLNDILSKEIGHTITLQGVTNYIKTINGRQKKYEYIINQIFKSLYDGGDKIKPKVFIFFNSVDDIENFKTLFQTTANDFTTQNSKFLKSVMLGVIAGHRRINGQKVDVSIQDRRKTITDFRNGQFKVLLATNIVARGIDIRDVCFVINVDAPREQKNNQAISIDTYLHRVGRTGRYSDQGIALTLVDEKDENALIDSVKKVHKVQIKKLVSLQNLSNEIQKCIKINSQAE